jgi:hypothetical protein
MLDGINHIFYHGTVYSPQDVPWPGWLFYASTQYNPGNPWWDDFGAMNRYIERVQSVLQHGTPDNDLLIYWPVFDVWDNPDGMTQQLGVHDVKWLTGTSAGRMAHALMANGYSFDYISDAQLTQTNTVGGELATPGARYKVLLVPAARRMPATTLEQILRLAENGATIVFESLPEDVPGHGRVTERRARFRAMLEGITFTSAAGRDEARVGRGRILRGDVASALAALPVVREPMIQTGIRFIRRAHPRGHDYFLANLSAGGIDKWVPLGVAADSAVLLDPLTGSGGTASLRGSGNATQVYLQLAPGESLILRTSRGQSPPGAHWTYTVPAGPPIAVTGSWRIEFVKGGPELPPAATLTALESWTELRGEAERFAGTARYRLEFDLSELARRSRPSSAEAGQQNAARTGSPDAWALDLGDVRESARVRLNGEEIATAWSVPFVVRLGSRVKSGRNVLELAVTNLAANRIRDMDRRGVPWKIMREINFVDINYRPFDASKWDVKPSGLLGPVRLIPLRILQP